MKCHALACLKKGVILGGQRAANYIGLSGLGLLAALPKTQCTGGECGESNSDFRGSSAAK